MFLFIVAVTCHAQEYKYLVLKGGGIRGIAYAGAIKVLEDKGIMKGIEKVAGTSVGAITGTLIATGCSASQIEEIMFGLNIADFNDGQGYFIGGQRRFRKKYGWYKGEHLEQWLGKIMQRQTGNADLNFRQLHELAKKDSKYKDLYITATDLTRQTLVVFSWETYPEMPIKYAVRASASIPLYYTAVFMDSSGAITDKPEKDKNYDILVDGGLLANYPIDIFNSGVDSANHSVNEYTLGLKLDRPDQIAYSQEHSGIAPFSIHSFSSYMGALYNLTIEQLNKRVPYEEEKKHSIYISTGNLNPKVRHISTAQKQLLYDNGVAGAKAFFESK